MDFEPDPGPIGQDYKRESSSRGYSARLRAKMLQLRSKREPSTKSSIEEHSSDRSTPMVKSRRFSFRPSTPSGGSTQDSMGLGKRRSSSLGLRLKAAAEGSLAVRLTSAEDLGFGMCDPGNCDPVVIMKVENKRLKSATITNTGSPVWNESFRFQVARADSAVLKISVFSHRQFGKNELLGFVHIPVAGVRNQQGLPQPAWYSLRNDQMLYPRGRIQLQLHFQDGQLDRPLNLLCSTFNLGNRRMSSEDMSALMGDAQQGEMDLITIGVQECRFARSRRGPNPATELSTPIGERDDSDSSNSDDGSPRLALIRESPALEGGMADEGLLASWRRMFGQPRVRSSSLPGSKVSKPKAMASFADAGRALQKVTPMSSFQEEWQDSLQNALGMLYWPVGSAHLGQMRLAVFCRADIYNSISGVCKSTAATGVGQVLANKGGVGVAFNVGSTSVCFVNSHLTAHQENRVLRNRNHQDIIRQLHLAPHDMDVNTGFHHTFWLGDLNYRIAVESFAGTQTRTPAPEDFQHVEELVADERYSLLLEHDQLKREMTRGVVFLNYREAPIHFMPTFKVERQAGTRYKAQRLPSWCDRILWRSAIPANAAECHSYYSVPEVSSSDHKPVSAVFTIPLAAPARAQSEARIAGRLYAVLSGMRVRGLLVEGKLPLLRGGVELVIAAPELKETVHSTSAARSNMTWPSLPVLRFIEGVCTESLLSCRLMVKVVLAGNYGNVGTTVLARGVLPLDFLVHAQSKPSTQPSYPFSIQLEFNGMHVGTLEGEIGIHARRRHTRTLAAWVAHRRSTNDSLRRTGSCFSEFPRRTASSKAAASARQSRLTIEIAADSGLECGPSPGPGTHSHVLQSGDMTGVGQGRLINDLCDSASETSPSLCMTAGPGSPQRYEAFEPAGSSGQLPGAALQQGGTPRSPFAAMKIQLQPIQAPNIAIAEQREASEKLDMAATAPAATVPSVGVEECIKLLVTRAL